MSKLKNTFGLPQSLIDLVNGIHESSHLSPKQEKIAKLNPPTDKIDGGDLAKLRSKKNMSEATGTYPFRANEIAPLLAVLRTILNFLSSSSSLKKIMKEETGIDDKNINSLITFFEVFHEELELLEYRTKGAVGKKNRPAPAATPAAEKKSDDEEGEEDEGPAYEAASGKDQEHIMTQLKGAMDTGGRHIDTAGGKKFVSKSTAEKIHTHLMGLKAPERAQSSSDLYNLKATHPMTKHIQDDHRASLEKGIKPPSDKKGRGRPKKSAT